MLELKNISKTFNAGTVNQKVALNGLNLTMNEGDFVTVIGGNGAGKSTMLNALKKYCSKSEQDTIDNLLNIFSVLDNREIYDKAGIFK